jgi:hypothetical protein
VPDLELAASITRLRSQRSASAPAKGESTMLGILVDSATSANCVTEPVRWNTNTPSANPLRPDPSAETSCPNHRTRKFLMPPIDLI